MSDIIKLYNPANAAGLTPEQIQGLQNLTTQEIGQLAKAYPNQPYGKGYLLIIDSTKPIEKQLPALSTFQNLYNLRAKNNFTQYVPFAFRQNYKPQTVSPVRPKRQEVVDLTDQELLTLPGFKTGVGTNREEVIPPETVIVTKVKDTPKKKGGRPKKNTNPK